MRKAQKFWLGFGDLVMQRWKIKTLGEIAEVQSGGTLLKARDEYWFGDIPWYSSGELNESFTQASKSLITKKGLEESNAKLFPKGSLLIGMYDTAALKMSILDKDAAFNQAIAGVKPNKNIDLKFILLAIESRRFEILNQRRGVRQKNLSLAKIKNIELSVPPLSEQKRIAEILDEVFEGIDRAIANTEKNRTNTDNLFENYLDKTFDQKGDDWIQKKLEDICSIKHGFAFKGEFFAAEKSDYILLTPGSFHESGGYRNQRKKYYIGEIPSGYILDKGDLLFAMTEQAVGLLGSSLIVPESDKFLHNQRLGLVQVFDDFEWHNKFFFHQFSTKSFRAHCCLLHVSNQRMSNQTLRERFRLSEAKTATVSLVIGATKETGLIKTDDSESASTRYARYLPFWA
jgi:type I restriction enzyme, S subunit